MAVGDDAATDAPADEQPAEPEATDAPATPEGRWAPGYTLFAYESVREIVAKLEDLGHECQGSVSDSLAECWVNGRSPLLSIVLHRDTAAEFGGVAVPDRDTLLFYQP